MCQSSFAATIRNASVEFRPSSTGPGGLLTIHGARYSAEYLVVLMPCSFDGRAFLLAKVEGHKGHRGDVDQDSYEVLIANDGGNDHDDCTCPGHTYRPNQPFGCKHISALRAVLADGWLTKPRVATVATIAEELPVEVATEAEEPVEAILARITRVATAYFEEQDRERKDAALLRLSNAEFIALHRSKGMSQAQITAEYRRIRAGNRFANHLSPYDTADQERW